MGKSGGKTISHKVTLHGDASGKIDRSGLLPHRSPGKIDVSREGTKKLGGGGHPVLIWEPDLTRSQDQETNTRENTANLGDNERGGKSENNNN